MPDAPPDLPRPWASDGARVLDALAVDPRLGLDEAEARRRLGRYGPNALRETKPASAWQVLRAQLGSLVVGLLLVAAGTSLAFGHGLEGAAILVVVAINTTIGFLTELRAVRSMEALRRLGLAAAAVRRGGEIARIEASGLVPGDVVVLEAGDVVTADVRLLEASKLQADESTLTGESLPVTKRIEPVAADAPLAERASMLFKGTALTRGSALAVVVATGMATELGRIASLAQQAEDAATPLEQRLEALGRRLVWVALTIALVTAAAGILQGQDVLLMVETGIALAVAAIPEGLPIVATLALARGMWRLARSHALVNRLSAVETLGATGVILCDKTGTLTENRMTVVRLVLPGGEVEVRGGPQPFREHGAPVDPARHDLRAALEIGVLCNNASIARGADEDDETRAVGDPMEVALLALGVKAELERATLLAAWPERREEAFDPHARAMATFHERDGRLRVAVKGAPEAVLDACRWRLGAGGTTGREDGRGPPAGDDGAGVVDLDEDERRRWLARSDALAREGLRVLGLAHKTAAHLDEAPYEDLVLVGLVGMLDPPRENTREALARCRDAGLRVVMATGDQAGTAASIARALGLDDDAEPILGRDLPDPHTMTDADRSRLLAASVFARVDPEHKLRLIQLHQDAGAVVAMTGDGINDAPALRKADIGIAMGRRGTQVAREAADMVLQDDAFSSIVRAIHQGRVIFANIRRFVLYLLSCNISEIMIVLGASVAGAPLPLLPLQILFLNLVTDVFPALALGFGEGEEGVMRRPPRDPRESLLARRHWIAVGVYGALISASVLAALALAVGVLGMDEARAVTVSFLTLAFAQVWHVLNMRQRGSTLLGNDVVRSPWVLGAMALCTLLLVAAVRVPVLSAVLHAPDPGAAGWSLALGASLVPLVAGQAWHELRRVRARGAAGER